MHVRYSLLASQATTALFVLLWGSAAIFTRWGLDNASPMALLDYLLLGNRLPAAAMIGMMAIVGGIVLVFRTAKVRAG